MSGIEDYARKLGAEWDSEEKETATEQFRRITRVTRGMLSQLQLSPEDIIEDPQTFRDVAQVILEATGFDLAFCFGLLVGSLFQSED